MDKAAAKSGALITTYAFKYACSFYEFADEKYPELKQYPSEKSRGTILEAAIIVATLILMERRSPVAGGKELHQGVAQAFPPTVQHRPLAAIQDLACSLLQTKRSGLRADEIPSFTGLLGAPDAKLVNAIGLWVTGALAKKPELDPTDLKIAAALGRSAWTSANMIVRMLSK